MARICARDRHSLRCGPRESTKLRGADGDHNLRELEFHRALELLLAACQGGTYEEWREAMRPLAAGTSPEQWEEVIERLRGRGHVAAVAAAGRERQ